MEELMSVIASFEFASPIYFWLGGAGTLLLIFLPIFLKRRQLRWDLGYWTKKMKQAGLKLESKKPWTLTVLIVITSLLIAAALANPQIVEKRSIPFYGKPVMVVIDISGSMEMAYGEEFSSSDEAWEVFNDITKQDLGAAIGLSLYSSESYIARDFTTKTELLKDVLENRHEIEEISSGTRTTLALFQAREFFSKEAEAKDKSIILISDLEDNLDWVSLEMKNSLEAGINLYVIVIQENPGSAYSGMQDLRNLTGISKIKMVWAGDKKGISQIYEEIRQMESSLTGEVEILSRKSLIHFLLPVIFGMALLCIILSETIFRKIP